MKTNTRKALYASVVGAVVVVSSAAQAAGICAGTAGNGSSIATTGSFVKVGFTPKCSSNVLLDAVETSSNYSVKSASTKGKTYYGGATDSGTVTVCSSVTTPITTVGTAGASGC